MPRDGSGNFDLEAGNPVVPGTTIATTWANPTLSDIAQGLSDSLDRFGRGGMEAEFRLGDGSESLPGIAFTQEPSTGMFREAQGILGFVTLGGTVLRINQDLVEFWTGTTWARFMPPVGAGYVFQAQEILQTPGNGSWDPAASPDCDLVQVRILGGGGGGGGANVTGANVVACGSGGGAGAYSEIFQTVGPNSTITGPVPYTVGAGGLGGVGGGNASNGGATVWNTTFTAQGGRAGLTVGLTTLAVDAVYGAGGGVGGVKGGGGVGQQGGPGSKGIIGVAGGVGRSIGGAGGNSRYGGGAPETQFGQTDQTGTAADATSYGAGGGGGAAGGLGTLFNNGGNGAKGVIILAKWKRLFGPAP